MNRHNPADGLFHKNWLISYAWPCQFCDHEVEGSNRQLSVPFLRGQLMSISKSWGVNGHITRSTSAVYVSSVSSR